MRYVRILGPVFFVLAVAGGALAALAPVAWPGLELFGSACGGGGEEQVCRDLTRRLTLVEIDGLAWLWVAGAAACAAIALSALVIPREGSRLVAAVAVFSLAVAGLVTTTQVDVLLSPDDGATVGRADERWGPYLRPALLDFRADARRRYEGRRERRGAPPFEREQILEFFGVHGLRGWNVLRATIIVLLFASLFEVARRSLLRPSLAFVIALTGGTLIWAVTEDQSFVGEPDASESYEGWLTALAVIAVAVAWAAYGLGVAAGRLLLPRLRRPRHDRLWQR
jgi:hypothetical protein